MSKWTWRFVFRHLCSAFRHSLFSILTRVAFLQWDFFLPEITFTLVGAMAFMTFLILELKWCTRSLTENLERGSVEEKASMNMSPVFSVMYHFETTSVWTFVYIVISLAKKTQQWSERTTSDTRTLEMFRPSEITKSRMWPLLCMGCVTCWVSPKLSRTQHSSLVHLSSGLLTWMC